MENMANEELLKSIGLLLDNKLDIRFQELKNFYLIEPDHRKAVIQYLLTKSRTATYQELFDYIYHPDISVDFLDELKVFGKKDCKLPDKLNANYFRDAMIKTVIEMKEGRTIIGIQREIYNSKFLDVAFNHYRMIAA